VTTKMISMIACV